MKTSETASVEITRFTTAVCEDALRDALHDLVRAAEAASTLKAELGMNFDDFEVYCQQEFSLPPQILIGLLEYHELKGQRAVNTWQS
jgi:hypothetical protein